MKSFDHAPSEIN